MFKVIFVLVKSVSCIVWWIYVYTLNLPSEVLFKGAERKKIVRSFAPSTQDDGE